jgi:hypothetical protein
MVAAIELPCDPSTSEGKGRNATVMRYRRFKNMSRSSYARTTRNCRWWAIHFPPITRKVSAKLKYAAPSEASALGTLLSGSRAGMRRFKTSNVMAMANTASLK